MDRDVIAAFGGTINGLISLALAVLVIVGLWKIFTKAGEEGWKSIIPFYNIYILLKIVGRPGWWLILYFIPFVNFIIAIIVSIDLAHSFGKGTGYGLLLFFFSPIMYAVLGFGDATYQGREMGAGAGRMTPPGAPVPH